MSDDRGRRGSPSEDDVDLRASPCHFDDLDLVAGNVVYRARRGTTPSAMLERGLGS